MRRSGRNNIVVAYEQAAHCCEFYIQGSVHREVYANNYPTIYSLFMSVNRSTCFGWYLHPSSGPHVTVSTVSGINKTVTATCRERDWTGSVVYTAMTFRFP